jgi:hypothetical protein
VLTSALSVVLHATPPCQQGAFGTDTGVTLARQGKGTMRTMHTLARQGTLALGTLAGKGKGTMRTLALGTMRTLALGTLGTLGTLPAATPRCLWHRP